MPDIDIILSKIEKSIIIAMKDLYRTKKEDSGVLYKSLQKSLGCRLAAADTNALRVGHSSATRNTGTLQFGEMLSIHVIQVEGMRAVGAACR